MPTTTKSITTKSFNTPDETRPIDKGKVEIVNCGDTTVMRARFEPGWKWSQSIKPLAGTDTCQVSHAIYCVSGRMHVKMDDGTETEVGPGDVAMISPGHDAWVVGNEPCVSVDFQGGTNYAKTR